MVVKSSGSGLGYLGVKFGLLGVCVVLVLGVSADWFGSGR